MFISLENMHQDSKLLALLDIVIDNYICKWEPVGSKFLHSLDAMEYAPSTLRKYLNILEKDGMVYQPYNSSWRIPTIQWLQAYIQQYLDEQQEDVEWELVNARTSLKKLVEILWSLSDWVVVWFLRNDEYYYLWINSLLKDDMVGDYEITRNIIRFIEEKRVVKFLDQKMMKRDQIYYTFIDDKNIVISCLYVKIPMEDFDGVISIIWPTRIDYKKNVALLRKLLKSIAK